MKNKNQGNQLSSCLGSDCQGYYNVGPTLDSVISIALGEMRDYNPSSELIWLVPKVERVM